MGDRHSQYDLWPNPLRDVESFRGRTFIVVGWLSDEARKAFDEVDQSREVVYSEEGRPISSWTVTVCRGYRGFPALPDGAPAY